MPNAHDISISWLRSLKWIRSPSLLAIPTHARVLLRRSPAAQEAFVGDYCIWTTSPCNKQFRGRSRPADPAFFLQFSCIAMSSFFLSPVDQVGLQMDYVQHIFRGLVSSFLRTSLNNRFCLAWRTDRSVKREHRTQASLAPQYNS
jgi:hypothetical protein